MPDDTLIYAYFFIGGALLLLVLLGLVASLSFPTLDKRAKSFLFHLFQYLF